MRPGPLIFLSATRDVGIIASFRKWDYVLHIEHILCVITNFGQRQGVTPSLVFLLSLSLSIDIFFFFKILIFQVVFIIFCAIL